MDQHDLRERANRFWLRVITLAVPIANVIRVAGDDEPSDTAVR